MDQDVDEIDQERNGEDELEEVSEVHIRSSQAAKANNAAIDTSIVSAIATSAIWLSSSLRCHF
jgi:hypothetical protein